MKYKIEIETNRIIGGVTIGIASLFGMAMGYLLPVKYFQGFAVIFLSICVVSFFISLGITLIIEK